MTIAEHAQALAWRGFSGRSWQHHIDAAQLTIRVSGYAVNFVRLTPKQQHDVISRTFHEAL